MSTGLVWTRLMGKVLIIYWVCSLFSIGFNFIFFISLNQIGVQHQHWYIKIRKNCDRTHLSKISYIKCSLESIPYINRVMQFRNIVIKILCRNNYSTSKNNSYFTDDYHERYINWSIKYRIYGIVKSWTGGFVVLHFIIKHIFFITNIYQF